MMLIAVAAAAGFFIGWFAASRIAAARLAAESAEVRARAAAQEEYFQRRLVELKEEEEKRSALLRESFRALSADLLRQQAPELVNLAKETLEKMQLAAQGELEKRQEAIAGLLKPLEEQLKTYQQRLQQSEQQQQQSLGEVKRQLEELGRQSRDLTEATQKFRQVLSAGQARGRWGEETLRRVVEAAGLCAHCDFTEQASGDEGRPDMIVHLPGDRLIIVDAKVPDLDFLSAINETDTEKRRRTLEAHARKLRETITALAGRDYPRQFPGALDYVVLFVPAESLFSAALEADRELIVWAAAKKILLATPASLIALLRSVGFSWQQSEQAENARAIGEAAQELYRRVAAFTEHLEKMGNALHSMNEHFDKAVGSYERQVRPQGERLLALGLPEPAKKTAELKEIGRAPRRLQEPGN